MNYWCISYIIGGLLLASPSHAKAGGQDSSSQPMQLNQSFDVALSEALGKIGGLSYDIETFNQSGELSFALIKSFLFYANNSSKSTFNALTSIDRNALVVFAFLLKNQGSFSPTIMKKLLTTEKIALGLNLEEIQSLSSLTTHMQTDSAYVLTNKDKELLLHLAPFIEENPFAFADFIGLAVRQLLVKNQGTTFDPKLKTSLIQSAKNVVKLSEPQLNNILSLIQTFEDTNTFTESQANITDVNGLLRIAALPEGAFLLFPVIGEDKVAGLKSLISEYKVNFNPNYVSYFEKELTKSS